MVIVRHVKSPRHTSISTIIVKGRFNIPDITSPTKTFWMSSAIRELFPLEPSKKKNALKKGSTFCPMSICKSSVSVLRYFMGFHSWISMNIRLISGFMDQSDWDFPMEPNLCGGFGLESTAINANSGMFHLGLRSFPCHKYREILKNV